MCGSLLIGRQARALCEAERGLFHEQVVQVVPSRVFDREPLFASAGMGLPLRVLSIPRARAPQPEPASAEDPVAVPGSVPQVPLPTPLLSGKSLPLFDINAGRALKVTPFDQEGVANPEAFAKLRSFMRCRRSGHEMDMDPRLIAVLSRISQHFGGATLQIISGHRKPDGKVTRETSQHAFGTAADIRIARVPIEELERAARALGARGVGLYTKGQFVHVDVRARPYSWRDRGEEVDEADDLPAATAAVEARELTVAALASSSSAAD